MKYCSSCGKEIADDAVICPHCGSQTERTLTVSVHEIDEESSVWDVISFFVPLIGFAFYILRRKSMPIKATAAAKCSIMGILIGIVIPIALVFLYVLFWFSIR